MGMRGFIWFLVLFLGVGWVANIFKLIFNEQGLFSAAARIVGIFLPPLGGIIGWF